MRLTGKFSTSSHQKINYESATENPKIPSNILHALSSVQLSQLMDQDLWDFKNLEKQKINCSIDDDNIIQRNTDELLEPLF